MKLHWNKKIMLKALLSTGLVIGTATATALVAVSCSNITSIPSGEITIDEKPGTKIYQQGTYENALKAAGIDTNSSPEPNSIYYSVDGGDFRLYDPNKSSIEFGDMVWELLELSSTIRKQIKNGEDCTANLEKINSISNRIYYQERFTFINKKITLKRVFTKDSIVNDYWQQFLVEFCVEDI